MMEMEMVSDSPCSSPGKLINNGNLEFKCSQTPFVCSVPQKRMNHPKKVHLGGFSLPSQLKTILCWKHDSNDRVRKKKEVLFSFSSKEARKNNRTKLNRTKLIFEEVEKCVQEPDLNAEPHKPIFIKRQSCGSGI